MKFTHPLMGLAVSIVLPLALAEIWALFGMPVRPWVMIVWFISGELSWHFDDFLRWRRAVRNSRP